MATWNNNTQSNPMIYRTMTSQNPRAKSLNFADYLIAETNIKQTAIMDI